MNLDDALSPSDVVDSLGKLGVQISERGLREKARRIGAYCEVRKGQMFFMPFHLDKLMEPEKCSNSQKGKTRPTGSRGGPSKVSELSEARARLKKPKP